ncbi:hypothetical protein Slin15195_G122950 [Septoria linicola]|uniref:Uncharacterized protein n=1 Tax=Septoria linicola TaxID=215465 RepID=A0A9Q9B9S7_9PEZI|nr:hypothetical protein Slin14017_G079150 [Septoria linicola]USW58976.1 hypothetical protein Slin15195_G122950 [Septoria linicola]
MASVASTTVVPTLDERIQALPQEMQDEIFSRRLALVGSADVIINDTYKPPAQLQVNQESRKEATDIYYFRPATFYHNAKTTDWDFDGQLSRTVVRQSSFGPIKAILFLEDFEFCLHEGVARVAFQRDDSTTGAMTE